MQDLLGQPRSQSGDPLDEVSPQIRDGHPDDSWRADALGKSRHARLSDYVREPLDDFDPERADRICAEACRSLLLDLTPALMTLAVETRRRCHALATYAQMLFDFAAQPGLEGERLAALNRIEFTLEESLAGAPAGQPVFVAMAAADRLEPWNQDALDRLLQLARARIVTSRPAGAAEAVARSEALGSTAAACLLGFEPPQAVVELAGALLRIRSLLTLDEGIRGDCAGLPVSELPERGDVANAVDREVVDRAVRAELVRTARSLESARRAARQLPEPYRRCARYLRLAALHQAGQIEKLGWQVVSTPPRLGLGIRLTLLARARLGLG